MTNIKDIFNKFDDIRKFSMDENLPLLINEVIATALITMEENKQISALEALDMAILEWYK